MATDTQRPVDASLQHEREQDWEAFTTFVTWSAGAILVALALMAIFLL